MKKGLITLIALFISTAVCAQKYTVEKSEVSFFSKATIENITARTTKSSSLLDTNTSGIVFVIPIGDFEFAKSLMKEHFNEKYMDTEKFPKATFEGKLSGFDPKVSGTQKATATGKMTIHGVTKDVEISGTIEMNSKNIQMKSKFIVRLADYNISIPTMFFSRIAEQVEVTVDFTYKPQ